MKYLVVIDGAGEYGSDFSVMVVEADYPRSAIDRVIGPEMGYGSDQDGVAYVTELRCVVPYRINDSTHRTAVITTFEKIVSDESVSMREYIDPDGGHREARLAAQVERINTEVAKVERSRAILTTPADDVAEIVEKIRASKA